MKCKKGHYKLKCLTYIFSNCNTNSFTTTNEYNLNTVLPNMINNNHKSVYLVTE